MPKLLFNHLFLFQLKLTQVPLNLFLTLMLLCSLLLVEDGPSFLRLKLILANTVCSCLLLLLDITQQLVTIQLLDALRSFQVMLKSASICHLSVILLPIEILLPDHEFFMELFDRLLEFFILFLHLLLLDFLCTLGYAVHFWVCIFRSLDLLTQVTLVGIHWALLLFFNPIDHALHLTLVLDFLIQFFAHHCLALLPLNGILLLHMIDTLRVDQLHFCHTLLCFFLLLFGLLRPSLFLFPPHLLYDRLLLLSLFFCCHHKIFVVELPLLEVYLVLHVLLWKLNQLVLIVLLFILVLNKLVGKALIPQPHLIDLLLILISQRHHFCRNRGNRGWGHDRCWDVVGGLWRAKAICWDDVGVATRLVKIACVHHRWTTRAECQAIVRLNGVHVSSVHTSHRVYEACALILGNTAPFFQDVVKDLLKRGQVVVVLDRGKLSN